MSTHVESIIEHIAKKFQVGRSKSITIHESERPELKMILEAVLKDIAVSNAIMFGQPVESKPPCNHVELLSAIHATVKSNAAKCLHCQSVANVIEDDMR